MPQTKKTNQQKVNKGQVKPPAAEKAGRRNKVHDVVRYETRKALPITFNSQDYYAPQTGLAYHPFLPPDDNLFKQLLELRLLSVTQMNCINDKTFYSIGAGLQVQNQEFPKNFDKKINAKRQLIDDVLKSIFESNYQDGNKFVEISVVKIGRRYPKIYVYAYPHNNLDIRLKSEPDTFEVKKVLRSREFRRDGIIGLNEKEPPLEIPLWTDSPISKDDVWMTDKNGVMRTMLHIKNEIQGIEPYGLPTNFSGMAQALLEHKVGKFNLDNFDNNMFLAGILSIMGQTSTEEGQKLLSDIRKGYIGEGKAQRIFVVSSEAGLNDTKFTPFQQNHEGHFVEFDKHNEGKIVSANQWSRELLDMQENSGLGKGGAYLAQLFQRKYRTVIAPVQQNIMNNFVFPMMQIIDEFQGTDFYSLPWYIKPVVPVSLEGALDLDSLLTVDEGREEIGKGKHPNAKIGGMQIAEVAAKSKGNADTGAGVDSKNPGATKTNNKTGGKK